MGDEYKVYEDGEGIPTPLGDDDVDYVEYFKLDLHPKSKEIQKDFNVEHKVNDLSVAEKIHFEEVYAEIKFLIFFGQEPTNNRSWYSSLPHNIRIHALHVLQRDNKIKIAGFDGTAALSTLKIAPKVEILAPSSGSFVITLADGMEVVIRLVHVRDVVEWTIFCKDSVEYSKWDKMFRAAVKEHNQYTNTVFDQGGKFIDLPQVTFDDIFLDKTIRTSVQTNIIDYMDEKKIRLKKLNGIPTKRGIIFTGIPGTGKTFLSKVLAHTLNVTFMVVTNLSSLDELKGIFKFVEQFDRVILLFEDIDIYIQHRDLGSGLLPTMLNTLDGIESISNHLIVICTTNNIEAFDDALKNRPGRFDVVIPFDFPGKALKCKMLRGFCKEKNVVNVDFENIVDKVSSAYTGAHLKELYISACVLAIEEGSVDEETGTVILTSDIFTRALHRIKHGMLTARTIGFGRDNDNEG